MHPAGQEIYLRRPSRYHLPEDRTTSFALVAELCRHKHETAIGYITAVRPAPSAGLPCRFLVPGLVCPCQLGMILVQCTDPMGLELSFASTQK